MTKFYFNYRNPIKLEKAYERLVGTHLTLDDYEGEWEVIARGGTVQQGDNKMKIRGKYLSGVRIGIEPEKAVLTGWSNYTRLNGIYDAALFQEHSDILKITADEPSRNTIGLIECITSNQFFDGNVKGSTAGEIVIEWEKSGSLRSSNYKLKSSYTTGEESC